jgi:hypothetical protein
MKTERPGFRMRRSPIAAEAKLLIATMAACGSNYRAVALTM